jgi:arginyl-tRNA synthetase
MKLELIEIIQRLYGFEVDPTVSRPEPAFGDVTTNVALQLAKRVQDTPRSVAEKIAEALREKGTYKEVSVAGPGFINIFLNDDALLANIGRAPEKYFANKKIVFEYSCPNAFKELHTGHLYQTIFGDMAANLMLEGGADLQRTSFGGDVGLHVAKSLYGIVAELGGEYPEKLSEVQGVFERANWISGCYVKGAKAYEDDAQAKQDIDELNKTIYAFHDLEDKATPLAQIYWITRQWSYDYFDAFYQLIDVVPMRYYPESQTAPVGLGVVREQLAKGILKESDGAVVFEGDESKHLHTRVFITSKGLPTYETKDIGVIWLEQQEYRFDHRYILTGNDQKEYMRVVFAAAEAFQPELAGTMTHLTNGTVKFADGQKMSSRLGNVTRALDVFTIVREKIAQLVENDQTLTDVVTLGAIKYAFARYSLGGDIAFNIEETVSLTGNSGPYLQYAHARARRIIEKLSYVPGGVEKVANEDRELVRKLGEYSEVLSVAIRQLQPHLICNYLFELSQEFNRYYEKNHVVGDENEAHRAGLVKLYADTLKAGLGILGIQAPDAM